MSSSELIDDSSDNKEVFKSDILDDFEDDIEDDIIILRDFSFISVSKNGLFFTIYGLVQLTICWRIT